MTNTITLYTRSMIMRMTDNHDHTSDLVITPTIPPPPGSPRLAAMSFLKGGLLGS
jgi:hypothetical protein